MIVYDGLYDALNWIPSYKIKKDLFYPKRCLLSFLQQETTNYSDFDL